MRFSNIILIFVLFTAGCTSIPLNRARNDFYSGNLVQADSALGECTYIPKKNRLLCYMEKGVILHYMKEYEESTRILLKASEFVKEENQVSIKDQSASVLFNDTMATYKGEYSERLWIHTFLMMNFLLQYKYDSALVEGKQALEVYDEHPKSLEGDHFTRALIALCYENMNLRDDARIEYEKLPKSAGGESLLPEPVPQGKGELVLFIAQGRVPEKIAGEAFIPPSHKISIPQYAEYSSYSSVTILADGNNITPNMVVTNMGDVTRKSLEDRAAQYITRQALRLATKEAIAKKVGEKSEVGELVARMTLLILEKADTRSWETLPGNITLVRILLDEGNHDLEISSGYSESIHLNIDIPEGRRVYQSVRF